MRKSEDRTRPTHGWWAVGALGSMLAGMAVLLLLLAGGPSASTMAGEGVRSVTRALQGGNTSGDEKGLVFLIQIFFAQVRALFGGGSSRGRREPVIAPPSGAPAVTIDPAVFGDCQEPDFLSCEVPEGARVGTHCGLEFQIVSLGLPEIGIPDDRVSCFFLTPTGFFAEWTKADGNYLARKGIRPGSRNAVITYRVPRFDPGDTGSGAADLGLAFFGGYGFTTDPLTEYYIVENWGLVRPPGIFDDFLGTITVDGILYDQYVNTRTGKASIEGDSTTFKVYWSVRRDKSTEGIIRVGPHFDAWESKGYVVGDFFEVSFLGEGINADGSIEASVAIQE